MSSSLRKRMLQASKNPYAGFFDEDDYGKIRDYIDTGSVLLNAQISGDPDKGFPSGKILQLAGPESTGKTFLCHELIKSAQKNGYFVVYYDTEAANDADSIIAKGIDPTNFLYCPTNIIEELTTSVINILDEVEDEEKVMLVIDSLGNLSTLKEIGDAKAGDDKRDMTRAQKLRAFFRTCTTKCGVKNVPMIAVNHVYAITGGSMFGPSQAISGGGGPAYANSCTIQLTKAQLKSGDNVIGGIFTSTTAKNRLAKEKTKIKIQISFEKGLAKYSGLDNVAVEMGWLILPERARTYRINKGGVIPEECQGKTKESKQAYKEWLESLPTVPKNIVEEGSDEEFWEDFLNSGFKEVLKDIFSFGTDKIISSNKDEELNFAKDTNEN